MRVLVEIAILRNLGVEPTWHKYWRAVEQGERPPVTLRKPKHRTVVGKPYHVDAQGIQHVIVHASEHLVGLVHAHNPVFKAESPSQAMQCGSSDARYHGRPQVQGYTIRGLVVQGAKNSLA